MFRFLSMVTAFACFATLGMPVNTAFAASSSEKVATPKQKQTAIKKTVQKTTTKKAVIKKAVVKKSSTKKVARKNSNIKKVSAKKYSAPATAAAPAVLTVGELTGLHLTKDPLSLRSNVAYVIDQQTSEVLFDKNAHVALPIASVTKLMTAYVVMESGLNLDEILEVTTDDIDREKHTGSRLQIGARLSRDDMLHIALMSSENRAASALGRHYPGGLPAFVIAMNAKAKELGMVNTHYSDSTGLSKNNVSSASDLAKLAKAAYRHPLIRKYSTDSKYTVNPNRGGYLEYASSNRLIRGEKDTAWQIGLQKTGFINEAGHCLVIQNVVDNRPVIMVFLDSKGKLSPVGDASRLRTWLASGPHITAHKETKSVSDQVKAEQKEALTLAQQNPSEFIKTSEMKDQWMSNMSSEKIMQSNAPQPKKAFLLDGSVEG